MQECLAGVKKGYIFGASGSVASSTPAATSTPTSASGTPTAAKPAAPAGSPHQPRPDRSTHAGVGQQTIGQADKDGNGSLSPTEFSGDFAAADLNKDGRSTQMNTPPIESVPANNNLRVASTESKLKHLASGCKVTQASQSTSNSSCRPELPWRGGSQGRL